MDLLTMISVLVSRAIKSVEVGVFNDACKTRRRQRGGYLACQAEKHCTWTDFGNEYEKALQLTRV